MTQAIRNEVEVEVPASRIMRERDEARETCRRSMAFAARCQEERDAARRDLERAAIGRLPKDQQVEELRALREFVRSVWNEIETAKTPDVAEILREFVAEHGEDCDVCDGHATLLDEVDDYSESRGHFTRPGGEFACEHCRGGRVPR